MNTNEKYHVGPENVDKMRAWLADRGGIAMWKSVNLSNPGASWSTPATTEGKPTTKPNWQCANEPSRVITSADDVVVDIPREVDRFHVATRMGSNDMSIKRTSGIKPQGGKPVGESASEITYR